MHTSFYWWWKQEKLIELVKTLDKKNDELERELKKYKNPNTPGYDLLKERLDNFEKIMAAIEKVIRRRTY